MKKANRGLKLGIILGILQTFFFTLPISAANRNDLLFDLQDTFNSPAADKVNGWLILIVLLACAVMLLVFYFGSSQRKKELQTSREMHLETIRNQKSPNQKRNWFRLTTNEKFEWVPIDEYFDETTSEYIKDHLIDISGGGLSFSTHTVIKAGQAINFLLSLGQKTPLPLKGKVIRVTNDDGVNIVSVQFVNIRDGQRDRIVSWILDNQRNVIREENLGEETAENAEEIIKF